MIAMPSGSRGPRTAGAEMTTGHDPGHRPRLVNRWPLPDQPDPALRRVLQGRPPTAVGALATDPDGRWLASGGAYGIIRIWSTATWQEHALLARHKSPADR